MTRRCRQFILPESLANIMDPGDIARILARHCELYEFLGRLEEAGLRRELIKERDNIRTILKYLHRACRLTLERIAIVLLHMFASRLSIPETVRRMVNRLIGGAERRGIGPLFRVLLGSIDGNWEYIGRLEKMLAGGGIYRFFKEIQGPERRLLDEVKILALSTIHLTKWKSIGSGG